MDVRIQGGSGGGRKLFIVRDTGDFAPLLPSHLPATLPLVRDVEEFGQYLAHLFRSLPKRGMGLETLGEEQLRELPQQWPRGEAALGALWGWLEESDRTGDRVAELRQRATQFTAAPRSGVERLLHAEFWRGQVRSRLAAWACSRLSPMTPTEDECLAVGLWLCAHEKDREARLPASKELSEARAGELELAHLLWQELGSLPPREERSPEWRRERMLEQARRVGEGSGWGDIERLRRTLRSLVRRRAPDTMNPGAWQQTDSLEGLISLLRPEGRA